MLEAAPEFDEISALTLRDFWAIRGSAPAGEPIRLADVVAYLRMDERERALLSDFQTLDREFLDYVSKKAQKRSKT